MKTIFCSQAHGSQTILWADKPVVIQLAGQSRYYTFSKQNGNRQHAAEIQIYNIYCRSHTNTGVPSFLNKDVAHRLTQRPHDTQIYILLNHG
jgi:hypothetical protein